MSNNSIIALISLLLVGIVLLHFGLGSNDSYVISSTTLSLSYLGTLCILVAIYIFLVRKNKAILSNIVLIPLLILLVEIGCYLSLGLPTAANKDFSLPDLEEGHIGRKIGTVPYADSVYHGSLISDMDTVYDVHYAIDKNNSRITPEYDSTKSEYALFFGCSIAFGKGIEDNETLPYYFQTTSERHNAYNYAFEGYGTNHMLARLEYQNLSQFIEEEEGLAVYVFFWDHIYRAIGSMHRYTNWMSNAPYYTFKEGQLVRRKMFRDGRPRLSKFYEIFHQSAIAKRFEIDLPIKLNQQHFDLISEMILKSKELYTLQFGNEDFFVAFYPSYIVYSKEEMDHFKSHLTDKGIEYIDLNDFLSYSAEHTLGGDPHPNPETNELLAKELLRRLENEMNTK